MEMIVNDQIEFTQLQYSFNRMCRPLRVLVVVFVAAFYTEIRDLPTFRPFMFAVNNIRFSL
jgi:hypothetical protein